MAAISPSSAPAVLSATADRGKPAVGDKAAFAGALDRANLDRASKATQTSRTATPAAQTAEAEPTVPTETASPPITTPGTLSASGPSDATPSRGQNSVATTEPDAQDATTIPLPDAIPLPAPVLVRPIAAELEITASTPGAQDLEDAHSSISEMASISETASASLATGPTLAETLTDTTSLVSKLAQQAIDIAKALAPPPVAAAIVAAETLAALAEPVAETMAAAASPSQTADLDASTLAPLASWVPVEGASARIRASRTASPAPTALIHPDLAAFQTATANVDAVSGRPGTGPVDAAQTHTPFTALADAQTGMSRPATALLGAGPGLEGDANTDKATEASSAGSALSSATASITGHANATAAGGSALAQSAIQTTALLAAQIARRIDARSTRFDMALTPDDLGRVDVSLDIDADGGLTARLAFDNPLAATELRGRAEELRRQLQDAGFTVGSDALSFSEREAGGSSGGSDRRFEQAAGRAFSGASRLNLDTDVAAAPPAWASLSQTPQGVDLKV